MTGHPGTERADPVAGDVRAVRRYSRGRYGAEDQGRSGKEGRTASGRRIGGIMRGRGMRARTRADGPNRPGRGPGAGRVRRPRFPVDGRPGVPHRPGRRVRRHGDRRAARRVRYQRIAVAQGRPLRQHAVAESTDRLLKKGLVCRNRYTTIEQLGHGPDDCVWWSDDQRLHSTLGYRSPKEFTEQGLVL